MALHSSASFQNHQAPQPASESWLLDPRSHFLFTAFSCTVFFATLLYVLTQIFSSAPYTLQSVARVHPCVQPQYQTRGALLFYCHIKHLLSLSANQAALADRNWRTKWERGEAVLSTRSCFFLYQPCYKAALLMVSCMEQVGPGIWVLVGSQMAPSLAEYWCQGKTPPKSWVPWVLLS